MTTKTIVFDRETKDFAMYLDGEFVGYAPTHPEATVILDQLAYDQALHEAAAAPSDMTIPPTEDILATVKERYDTARLHDDAPGARQLDRVRVNVDRGARLSWSLGDLLIQSVNRPGAVYSVNRSGCTCPNGVAGKAQCWHVCLYDLLIDMAEERAAAADILADAAAERAEAAAEVDLGRRLANARASYPVAA